MITAAGNSNTSASTSATAGNGTATCSGTAVVTTVLTGFALTFTTTAATNVVLPTTGTLAARLSGSAALDFPSINDGACGAALTFAVTGAVAGDAVAPEWPSTLESGLIGMMWVTSSNTVSVIVCNLSGAAVNPANQTFGAVIVR